MKLPMFTAALLLVSSGGLADQIYKSTDAQGRVVYSDRPPAGKAEIVAVESAPRNEAAAKARAEQELEIMKARDQQRKRKEVAKQAQKKAAATAAKTKDERCMTARNMYLSLMEHSNVYDRDAAGNRVYFTGPQLDEKREEWRQRMEQECK